MGSLYSDVPSWLHRVPAGAKLAVLALAGMLLLLLPSAPYAAWQAGAFALVLALYLSLGAASRPTRRLVRMAAIAAALVAGFHALAGQPVLGLESALRLQSCTMLGAMLTATTRFGELLAVAERCLAPLQRFGVRTERLALQLGLMLRFTEHFFVQWARLDDAHRIRTGKAGGLRLLAPLTIRMLMAARKVADALVIRLGA